MKRQLVSWADCMRLLAALLMSPATGQQGQQESVKNDYHSQNVTETHLSPTPFFFSFFPATEASTATPAEAAPTESAPTTTPDGPWIETVRCTTCNECTQLNDRMFAYNEDMRAYIADPDAGTYRELVEAAETCQVAIIHPGKPRNTDEPGLEELVERARPFQ